MSSTTLTASSFNELAKLVIHRKIHDIQVFDLLFEDLLLTHKPSIKQLIKLSDALTILNDDQIGYDKQAAFNYLISLLKANGVSVYSLLTWSDVEMLEDSLRKMHKKADETSSSREELLRRLVVQASIEHIDKTLAKVGKRIPKSYYTNYLVDLPSVRRTSVPHNEILNSVLDLYTNLAKEIQQDRFTESAYNNYNALHELRRAYLGALLYNQCSAPNDVRLAVSTNQMQERLNELKAKNGVVPTATVDELLQVCKMTDSSGQNIPQGLVVAQSKKRYRQQPGATGFMYATAAVLPSSFTATNWAKIKQLAQDQSFNCTLDKIDCSDNSYSEQQKLKFYEAENRKDKRLFTYNPLLDGCDADSVFYVSYNYTNKALCAVCQVRPDYKAWEVLYLDSRADKDKSFQGAGSRILASILYSASNSVGIEYVYLTSATPARGFYLKMGFVTFDFETFFYDVRNTQQDNFFFVKLQNTLYESLYDPNPKELELVLKRIKTFNSNNIGFIQALPFIARYSPYNLMYRNVQTYISYFPQDTVYSQVKLIRLLLIDYIEKLEQNLFVKAYTDLGNLPYKYHQYVKDIDEDENK